MKNETNTTDMSNPTLFNALKENLSYLTEERNTLLNRNSTPEVEKMIENNLRNQGRVYAHFCTAFPNYKA
tara:strand:+ start:3748 stop:3957 length:210 start_codon:yes stop_codon:yes gene_type:complete